MPYERFEWDETKNLSNKKKHGVSFEDASEVFNDPFHFSTLDQFSGIEERSTTYGIVDGLVLLMVAHTYRDDSGAEVIRLISARRATRRERQCYEREND